MKIQQINILPKRQSAEGKQGSLKTLSSAGPYRSIIIVHVDKGPCDNYIQIVSQ